MTEPTASATSLLDAATAMGAVTLFVENLDRVGGYYTHGVGLDVLAEEGSRRILGRGGVPVLVLEQQPSLARASQRSAGLFHTAILFESEAALAAAVYSVARKFPGSFTGSSDHFVSEAFYFDDPEGNGVELYRDRPRSAWRTGADGQIEMGTVFLDPNAYLQAHLTEGSVEDPRVGGASVGHVHLQVGDIPTAERFYAGVLGFDVTVRGYPGALFVSAGGYHHHIGMNTWNSAGAGKRAPSLGLGEVKILVPSTDAVAAIADRIRTAGLQFADDAAELTLPDPWDNTVRIGTV